MSAIRDRIVELRRVPASELLADPRNWRRHPPAQQRALRAMLADVGFANALLARETPEGLRLIDGHLRAELTPQEIVPVLVLDVDEAEAGVLLASLDPLAGMADADPEALAELLASVSITDEELLAHLRSMAALTVKGLSDPDAVPKAPAEPTTRPGELWRLGDHRLLCGDATSPEDVARLLAGEEPALMATDPPYGVALDTEWRERAGLNARGRLPQGGGRRAGAPVLARSEPSYARNASIAGDTKADWSQAYALVPSLRVAYVWHGALRSGEVLAGLRSTGWELFAQVIWDKGVIVISRGHYNWQHEPCFVMRRPRAPIPWYGGRAVSTVWAVASPRIIVSGAQGPQDARVDHPTQKPVEVYRRPITYHLRAGGSLYEPFSGSGTALIAAEMTGRRCYAMEIDPVYVDVAVARWEAFTGCQAVLDRG